MKVYRLSRYWDAGLHQNSKEYGLFATAALAREQAKILEPRKEIRDYEYFIEPVTVKEAVNKRMKK